MYELNKKLLLALMPLFLCVCAKSFSAETIILEQDSSDSFLLSDNIVLNTAGNALANDNLYFPYGIDKKLKLGDALRLAVSFDNGKPRINLSIADYSGKPLFIRLKSLDTGKTLMNGWYYTGMINLHTSNSTGGGYDLYIKYDSAEYLNKFLVSSKLPIMIKKDSSDPFFVRLSNVKKENIINGYIYGNTIKDLSEGFYSLYIKDGPKELFKNILIKGKNKGVTEDFGARSVRNLRDIPYLNNVGNLVFNWFPVRYSGVKFKYAVQILDSQNNLSTYFSEQDSFFEMPKFGNRFKYRVIAFPEVYKDEVDQNNLAKYFDLSNLKFQSVDLNKLPKINYLFGSSDSVAGKVENLSLYYPSGFAFGEDEWVVSSADGGYVVVVRGEDYKKYIFYNPLGMPLKLASPQYLGNSKYLLTDNRSYTLVVFDSSTGNIKHIAGDKGKVAASISDSLYFNSKLGLMSGLDCKGNDCHLAITPAFLKNPNSWYTIPNYDKNDGIYNVDMKRKTITKINVKKSFCEKYACKAFLKYHNDVIVRGDAYMARLNRQGKVVWKREVEGFGAGLLVIGDGLLVGSHTKILRLNINTGEEIPLSGKISFANIVDIDKGIAPGELVVTDSDQGSVFFMVVDNDELKLRRSISVLQREPNFIRIKKYDDNLYVMTSNPSYLFSFDVSAKKSNFLIGNGENAPAGLNQIGLNSSLQYPNDFLLLKDSILIPEANNRIVEYHKKSKIISLFAGSRHHGTNIVGQANCDSPLFANVRSIILDNDSESDNKFIISDAGNNRIISLTKEANKVCNIQNIKLLGQGGKLNYPTFLYNKSGFKYLIEQDGNVVYQLKNKKIVDTIGKRKNTVYQGMGDDNKITVDKQYANFSTPTDICFDKRGFYITDTFNGKIKYYQNNKISNLKVDNPNYVLPMACEYMDNHLYYVDSITNRVFFQKEPYLDR